MSQTSGKQTGKYKIDPALLAWMSPSDQPAQKKSSSKRSGGSSKAKESSQREIDEIEATLKSLGLSSSENNLQVSSSEESRTDRSSGFDLDAIVSAINSGASKTKTRVISTFSNTAESEMGNAIINMETERQRVRFSPIHEADFIGDLNRLSVFLSDKVQSVRIAAVNGIVSLLQSQSGIDVGIEHLNEDPAAPTIASASETRSIWKWGPVDDGQTRAFDYELKMGTRLIAVEGAGEEDELEASLLPNDVHTLDKENSLTTFECEEDRMMRRLANGEKLELTSFDEERIMKRAHALAVEMAHLEENQRKKMADHEQKLALFAQKLTSLPTSLKNKSYSQNEKLTASLSTAKVQVSVQPLLSTDAFVCIHLLVKPLLKRLVDPLESVRTGALRSLALIFAILPANVPRLGTSWQLMWHKNQMRLKNDRSSLGAPETQAQEESAGLNLDGEDEITIDGALAEDSDDDFAQTGHKMRSDERYGNEDDNEEDDDDDSVLYLSNHAKKSLLKQLEGDYVIEWSAKDQSKDEQLTQILCNRKRVYLSLPGESSRFGLATLLPFVIPSLAMRLVDPAAEFEVPDSVKEQAYAQQDYQGDQEIVSDEAKVLGDNEEEVKQVSAALAAIRQNSLQMSGVLKGDASQYVTTREPSRTVRCELVGLLSILIQRCNPNELKPYLSDIVYMAHSCILDRTSPQVPVLTATRVIIPLSRIFPRLIKPAAPSLIYAFIRALGNASGKGRLAFLGAIEILVQCGGSDQIRDLAGFREHNVIVIKELTSASPRINHLSILGDDRDPRVRNRLVTLLGNWLTTLPDRHDYETLLMPYLLGLVSDHVLSVSANALSRLISLGRMHELDEYARLDDEIFYENELDDIHRRRIVTLPLLLPEPFGDRPGSGLRAIGRKFLPRLVGALVDELTDWKQNTRGRSADLLKNLLVLCEDFVNSHVNRLVPGYLAAQAGVEEKRSVNIRNWIPRQLSSLTKPDAVSSAIKIISAAMDTEVDSHPSEIAMKIGSLMANNGVSKEDEKVLLREFSVYPYVIRYILAFTQTHKGFIYLRDSARQAQSVGLDQLVKKYSTTKCELPEDYWPCDAKIRVSSQGSGNEALPWPIFRSKKLRELTSFPGYDLDEAVDHPNVIGMQLLARYAKPLPLLEHLLRHASGEGIAVGAAGLDAEYRARAWGVLATMIPAMPTGIMTLPVAKALLLLKQDWGSEGIWSRHGSLSFASIRSVCAIASLDWPTVRRLCLEIRTIEISPQIESDGTLKDTNNDKSVGTSTEKRHEKQEDFIEKIVSESKEPAKEGMVSYALVDLMNTDNHHKQLLHFYESPLELLYHVWDALSDASAWIMHNSAHSDVTGTFPLDAHFNGTLNLSLNHEAENCLRNSTLIGYSVQLRSRLLQLNEGIARLAKLQDFSITSAMPKPSLSAGDIVEIHFMLQKAFTNLYLSYLQLSTGGCSDEFEMIDQTNQHLLIPKAIAEGIWPRFLSRRIFNLMNQEMNPATVLSLRHAFIASVLLSSALHPSQNPWVKIACRILHALKSKLSEGDSNRIPKNVLAESQRFFSEILLAGQETIAPGTSEARRKSAVRDKQLQSDGKLSGTALLSNVNGEASLASPLVNCIAQYVEECLDQKVDTSAILELSELP